MADTVKAAKDEETKEETVSQDSTAADVSQDSQAGEEAPKDAPQDPAKDEDKKEEGKTTNVHKLERDIANRDKRIKELEAELETKAGDKSSLDERISALEKQLADTEQARADAEANAVLSKEGCIDCDLGRVALAAVDGDIDKLKEMKPYLFFAEKKINTTGKTAGSASNIPKNIKEAFTS